MPKCYTATCQNTVEEYPLVCETCQSNLYKRDTVSISSIQQRLRMIALQRSMRREELEDSPNALKSYDQLVEAEKRASEWLVLNKNHPQFEEAQRRYVQITFWMQKKSPI